MTAIERFAAKWIPEPNTGCWLWLDANAAKGYGQLRVAGRRVYAHRFSYELHVGPIPEGLDLDHLCRVRCCVNPTHLEPVDHATNVRRGRVGEVNAAKTHCPASHEYSSENTYRRKGQRLCRACTRDRMRAHRAQRRACA